MNFKKKRIVLFLALCFLPALTLGAGSVKNTEAKSENDPIASINTFVKEKTPTSVGNALNTMAKFLEKTRINVNGDLDAKKVEVKKEIKKLAEKKVQTVSDKILIVFKYLEVFFLSLSYFIFSNKIFFYCFLALTVFFVLRFFWRLIF